MTKTIAFLFNCLLAAAVACADEPPSEHVRKLVEGYRQAAVRVNGARLRITVDGKGKLDPATTAPLDPGPPVAVHWSIDYDGPRPPLTILKPTLKPAGHAQTRLVFFLIAADGEGYPVTIAASPPNIPGIFLSDKDDFVTIEPKETARGAITVSWSRVWTAAQDRWPGQFAAGDPRAVYVQLRHGPTDRAEHLGLDAWTGQLQTELAPAPLEALRLK
ncbi:MAG: hypothetical protein RIC55_03070 [Pirellulaceae bacterium]